MNKKILFLDLLCGTGYALRASSIKKRYPDNKVVVLFGIVALNFEAPNVSSVRKTLNFPCEPKCLHSGVTAPF
jgi:hypothetical protein